MSLSRGTNLSVDGDARRVLIVDDEPVIRQLVRRMLEGTYDVVEAQNGEEAVAIARNKSPSIILMDIMMPKMDGLSACCAIKRDAQTGHIPVIMLTAITHELNERLSLTVMGADGYITKPFDPEELLLIVKQMLIASGT